MISCTSLDSYLSHVSSQKEPIHVTYLKASVKECCMRATIKHGKINLRYVCIKYFQGKKSMANICFVCVLGENKVTIKLWCKK